jgi:RHS repeat-associated protein
VDVFFDDFSVTQVKSPVIQTDDYYPFGLTYNSYQRESSVPNRFKFQGQEHIDDLSLGWDSFKWRNHMPDIGRFFNVDPLAEKYYYNSPYAFSENKVVGHVELEGLESIPATGTIQQKVDEIYSIPPPTPTKMGNEGADGVANLTISVGLQGGYSFKVFGHNASFFVNFGSVDLVNIHNEAMDFKKTPDTDIKEGFDFGIGPVGISKEIQTSRKGENGNFIIETNSKTTYNVYNFEMSENTQKREVNPESTKARTTETSNRSVGVSQSGKVETSNRSVGVSQSGKVGAIVVIQGSLGISYTDGRPANNSLNPRFVAADAVRVSPPIRRPFRR